MLQRSDEEPASTAADPAAGGQDLGGLFEVRVERSHGVAGEVDELCIAEDVAVHRCGALVVGVELVQSALESLMRVANRSP